MIGRQRFSWVLAALAATALLGVGALPVAAATPHPTAHLVDTAQPATTADTGAGRAAGWTQQDVGVPQGPNGTLDAVSCSSAKACIAVGTSTSTTGEQQTLAQIWNGSTWTVQKTVNPAGGTAPSLNAVSCASASACTAVGDEVNRAARQVTLVERWNGASWSVQQSPDPAGGQANVLDAVSCASASACTAVGTYNTTSGVQVALAESWNATTWTVTKTVTPPGATYPGFDAVSCTSPSACTAAGSASKTSGAGATLVERWNGATWTLQTTPNPTGGDYPFLTGVSCSTATTCTAVGTDMNSAGTGLTFAEAWHGTTWTLHSTVNVSGASATDLNAVSCSSAADCTAVGDDSDATGMVTLAEVWNGAAWKVQKTTDAIGGEGFVLNGVSCPSTAACESVGDYIGASSGLVTIAEGRNAGTWTLDAAADVTGAQSSSLYGVSCPTATRCTAVGGRDRASLAETDNAGTWSVGNAANPAGSRYASLAAVSCVTTTQCEAVGYSIDSSNEDVSFAEGRNGATWTAQRAANAPGSAADFLNGISCTSPTACIAVGYYASNSGIFEALSESWNGSTWAVSKVAVPTGNTGDFLNEVSCTSASACTAVGAYAGSSGVYVTLAEVWNGASWKIQKTADPTAAEGAYLFGVSCTSPTACTAVGYTNTESGNQLPLAETLSATTWTVHPTPTPSGASDVALNSVSCSAASACTAVGTYSTRSGQVTLAEKWNGSTWTTQPTTNAAKGGVTVLSGVVCNGAAACTAVGSSDGSLYLPYVEAES